MKSLAIAGLAFASVIAGFSYLWQKLALDGLPPATVILGRVGIALACTAVLFVWKRRRLSWPFERRETGRIALVGTIGFAVPLLLGIEGVKRSTAGNASILILLEPASILVFSRLLLGERIGRTRSIGVAAGIAGALVIVAERAPVGDLLSADYRTGNALLAVQAFLWGVFAPLAHPLTRSHGPIEVVYGAMATSLLVLVPAALLESGDFSGGPALGRAIFWTVVLGVVVSFLTTLLWAFFLKHMTASATAPFAFLQPLAGVGAGAVVLGERLSGGALLGGVVIGAGMLLVAGIPRPRRRLAAPPEGLAGLPAVAPESGDLRADGSKE